MTWSTSSEVVAALRLHHSSPVRRRRRGATLADSWLGGALCVEIGSPRRIIVGPRGGRRKARRTRADAIFADVKTSRLIGYEIKVSRADLLSELANPSKALEWSQYCDEFWLVCPREVVAGLEDRVPAAWGIYVPPSGNRVRALTPLRRATLTTPISVGGWSRVVGFLAWRQLGLPDVEMEDVA